MESVDQVVGQVNSFLWKIEGSTITLLSRMRNMTSIVVCTTYRE